MNIKKIVGTVLGICAIATSISVFAGTSFVSYDTTVGRFNGSGYTGYQKKATSGANAELNSTSVGGNYTVDVRMIDAGGDKGPWTRSVTDNTSYSVGGKASQYKDEQVRLEFSNDLKTRVNVQVYGEWKSN